MARRTLLAECRRGAPGYDWTHDLGRLPTTTTPTGALFALGAAYEESDDVVGVSMVGRPVSRYLDNGWTAEVSRLCVVESARNAASLLLAASWRAARALGWLKLITYTLPEEGGASLRGAGWVCVGEAGGGSWSCKSRPRVDAHPMQVKMRWEAQ